MSYIFTIKDIAYKNIYFDLYLQKEKHEENDYGCMNVTYESQKITAMVDTGAVISGISKRIAQTLKLESIRTENFMHAQGYENSPVYLVDVVFPNDKIFKDIEVIETADPCDNTVIHDFLIGMNILRQGDFAITSVNGKMCFSFICPPREKYIDFNSYK